MWDKTFATITGSVAKEKSNKYGNLKWTSASVEITNLEPFKGVKFVSAGANYEQIKVPNKKSSTADVSSSFNTEIIGDEKITTQTINTTTTTTKISGTKNFSANVKAGISTTENGAFIIGADITKTNNNKSKKSNKVNPIVGYQVENNNVNFRVTTNFQDTQWSVVFNPTKNIDLYAGVGVSSKNNKTVSAGVTYRFGGAKTSSDNIVLTPAQKALSNDMQRLNSASSKVVKNLESKTIEKVTTQQSQKIKKYVEKIIKQDLDNNKDKIIKPNQNDNLNQNNNTNTEQKITQKWESLKMPELPKLVIKDKIIKFDPTNPNHITEIFTNDIKKGDSKITENGADGSEREFVEEYTNIDGLKTEKLLKTELVTPVKNQVVLKWTYDIMEDGYLNELQNEFLNIRLNMTDEGRVATEHYLPEGYEWISNIPRTDENYNRISTLLPNGYNTWWTSIFNTEDRKSHLLVSWPGRSYRRFKTEWWHGTYYSLATVRHIKTDSTRDMRMKVVIY